MYAQYAADATVVSWVWRVVCIDRKMWKRIVACRAGCERGKNSNEVGITQAVLMFSCACASHAVDVFRLERLRECCVCEEQVYCNIVSPAGEDSNAYHRGGSAVFSAVVNCDIFGRRYGEGRLVYCTGKGSDGRFLGRVRRVRRVCIAIAYTGGHESYESVECCPMNPGGGQGMRWTHVKVYTVLCEC